MKHANLHKVYRCTKCGSSLSQFTEKLACVSCDCDYPLLDGIPIFGSKADIKKWTAYYTDSALSHRIAGGAYTSDLPAAPNSFYSRFIPENTKNILDAGGGDGSTTADWAIRHHTATVHVMDLSMHGLKKVHKRRLNNMLPVCAAADLDFPFPDNYFDLVNTVFMVEHLSPISLAKFYNQAWRVLQPGGKLVVASDSPFYDAVIHPLERLLRHGRLLANDPTHINLMRPQQCEAGIQAARFKLEDRRIHWIAGRWLLARIIYRLLPQNFSETMFSTMYIISARKPV